jgi:hypothetical protein
VFGRVMDVLTLSVAMSPASFARRLDRSSMMDLGRLTSSRDRAAGWGDGRAGPGLFSQAILLTAVGGIAGLVGGLFILLVRWWLRNFPPGASRLRRRGLVEAAAGLRRASAGLAAARLRAGRRGEPKNV